jgi:vitamin B12 transporter
VSEDLRLGFNGFYENGSAEFDDFVFVPPGSFAPGDGTIDDEQMREALGLRVWGTYVTGAWEHRVNLTGYSVEREVNSNGLVSNFDGRRYALDYQAAGQVSDQLQLAFGLSAQEEVAKYANTPGGQSEVSTQGVFGEAIWSPNAELDLTGTVRYDDNSAFGGKPTGRLAFAWRPDDLTVVRGAVSTGYRPPSLDELFGVYPGFFPFVGNPNLQPEDSESYEIGIDRQFTNGATLSATLFQLDIENLITFQTGTPSTLVNLPGTSTRSGIALAGSYPVNDRVVLNGAYTYIDSEDATGAKLDRVPDHDLVLGFNAGLTERLRMGFAVQYVAGLNDGGMPLNDYTVADVRFAYEVTEELEAYFRIDNLADEQYQTIRGYGTSDRAFYVGLSATF